MFKLTDFSAVIFDMDGLVLDTEKTYRAAWQKAAFEMGYEFSDAFFVTLSGLQAYDVEQALKSHCGAGFHLDEFNRLSTLYWRKHVYENGIDVKFGFFSLLDFLVKHGIPYGLATNSTKTNAVECLDLAGLKGIFSIIVTRELVREGKPAPDIFIKTADELRVPIGRCLVLEDSDTGVEAASRAGALTVLIPSKLPVNASTASLCDGIASNLEQFRVDLEGAHLVPFRK